MPSLEWICSDVPMRGSRLRGVKPASSMNPSAALLALVAYAITGGFVVLYMGARVLLRLSIVATGAGATERQWAAAARTLPTASLLLIAVTTCTLLGGWALLKVLAPRARQLTRPRAVTLAGLCIAVLGSIVTYYAFVSYWVPPSSRDSDVGYMILTTLGPLMLASGLLLSGAGLVWEAAARRRALNHSTRR